MGFRTGQHVSTATPIPGAHVTPDGRAMGVFVNAQPGAVVDGVEEVIPAHVAFYLPSGLNLMRLDESGQAVKVAVDPALLEDIKAVELHDHLPDAHRNPDLPEGTKLKA